MTKGRNRRRNKNKRRQAKKIGEYEGGYSEHHHWRYKHIWYKLLIELFVTALLSSVFFWSFTFGIFGVLSFSLVMMGVTYAGMRYTGGFYNPALVFAAMVVGRSKHLGHTYSERFWTGLAYIGAQFLGAFVSIAITALIIQSPAPPLPDLNFIITPIDSIFVGLLQFTFVVFLSFIFLSVTSKSNRRKGIDFGLVVGLTYFAFAIVLSQFSGSYGILNPAISIVSNIVNAFPIWSPWNPLGFFSALMYFLFDMIAALAGAGAYYFVTQGMGFLPPAEM